MNPTRDAWLFWTMFADNPGTKDWELGVIKLRLTLDIVKQAFEENTEPRSLVEQFGEGVATVKVSAVTIKKAASVGYEKIEAKGWLSIDKYMAEPRKYQQQALLEGLTLYGCVPMEQLPENIKLQALAGETL